MATIERLRALYEEYEKKAQQVRSKASAFAGAFNMGDDPRRHACHEEFYEAVGEWVAAFLATEPDRQSISEAVRWILEAPDTRRGEDVYWYMYAAQSLAGAMIPSLSREECAVLADWYANTYPALDRLPAQEEICRLLRKQSGATEKKQGGWKIPFLKRK